MRHGIIRSTSNVQQSGLRLPARTLPATLTLLFVAFALILSACGGGSTTGPNTGGGGSVKTGGKLSVGLPVDPTTLDPTKSTSLYDRQVMLNMYDRLVRIDEQNKVQPMLATSWQYTNPDNTVLVFTLRDDVKFHDGTKFNAAAVVFNINRILTNKASPRLSEISSIKSVEAVDDTHVQFTLKTPFAPLLANLTDRAGMILSPDAIQKLGDDKLQTAPVGAGSGPFMFTEWVKSDHLLLTANPNYWAKDAQGNKLPYLASLRYRPITDENTMYANFQAGDVQIVTGDSLDPKVFPQIQANSSNFVFKQIPALGFNGFMLNTKAGALSNLHVRRAIAFAVDRTEILHVIGKDQGVVSHGPIPPSSWAYDANYDPFGKTANLDQAKAELQQAGVSSVNVTYLIASGSPLGLLGAQLLQSELQKAGINITIKQETFDAVLSDTAAGKFEMAGVGWSGRPDPDGNTFAWFHTGGGFNNTAYSNAQVDKLLESARASADQATRTQDYQQAEKMIVEDASFVFTNHPFSYQISSTKVKNFTILPTTIMVFTDVYLG